MTAVTRLGDLCSGHPPCYEPRPSIQGSPDVFANTLPIVRVGDAYAIHGHDECTPHGGVLAAGSPNVFANGIAVGRIGDPISCGSTVAQGSPNVFAN